MFTPEGLLPIVYGEGRRMVSTPAGLVAVAAVNLLLVMMVGG